MKRLLQALAVLCILPACHRAPSAPSRVASCTVPPGLCFEYAPGLAPGDAENACTTMNGAWRTEPCARTDVVARCEIKNGVVERAYAPLKPKDLQDKCPAVFGQFVVGP